MCWQVVNHRYSAPGTYTVELEVREQWPSLTDATMRQVTVQGAEPVYLPLVFRGDTD